MAQKVILSKIFCDEHLAECWQAYNTGTGQAQHIESFTAHTQMLKEHGFIYTGHEAGQYTYTRRAGQPLALDWSMLADAKEQAEIIQDW